jgi:hypothetical protein
VSVWVVIWTGAASGLLATLFANVLWEAFRASSRRRSVLLRVRGELQQFLFTTVTQQVFPGHRWTLNWTPVTLPWVDVVLNELSDANEYLDLVHALWALRAWASRHNQMAAQIPVLYSQTWGRQGSENIQETIFRQIHGEFLKVKKAALHAYDILEATWRAAAVDRLLWKEPSDQDSQRLSALRNELTELTNQGNEGQFQ